MTDSTNTARQARYRKARALGYEHVSGYLPPKRAAKVRQWLAEAEQIADAARMTRKKEGAERMTQFTMRAAQPDCPICRGTGWFLETPPKFCPCRFVEEQTATQTGTPGPEHFGGSQGGASLELIDK